MHHFVLWYFLGGCACYLIDELLEPIFHEYGNPDGFTFLATVIGWPVIYSMRFYWWIKCRK